MRVFVAGAAGAIGQQLLPQLAAQGHQVTATTRSPGKTALLRELGAEPVVVDGLDAAAVGRAVAQAEPEVVIHQMTSLAGASTCDLRQALRRHQQAADGRDRPPAGGVRGRGRQAFRGPELHGLDEPPQGGRSRRRMTRSTRTRPPRSASRSPRSAPGADGAGCAGDAPDRAQVRLALRAGRLRRHRRMIRKRKLPIIGNGAGSGRSCTFTTPHRHRRGAGTG